MSRIEKATPAHYESHEVPFGRSYEWHPEQIIVECDCGQKLLLTGTSNLPSCPECGLDYGSLVHEIRRREKRRLRDEDEHPWQYDDQGQEDQHYETSKLILRIRPGATTTLRRASWVTMKCDGRRLGSGKGFRSANGIGAFLYPSHG